MSLVQSGQSIQRNKKKKNWWRCFSMVANHWSNDAMVTIHRSAWVQLFTWYSTVIHCCCCYQNSYIFCIYNIFSLSLFQLCWFSQPPISNVLLYFLFFTFFIKFYSSIEIDCCIFFLSEILVKNVLRSFLWIQDFIILGTQDPGILRSWKPRILGSWDFRILIS